MPKKKGWDGKVPFTESGNMLGYPSDYLDRTSQYRDNYVFEATLTYEKFDGGVRSARRLWFHDEDDHKCCMFISELKQALTVADVKGLQFTARWTFRKQGQEYSIVAVEGIPR